MGKSSSLRHEDYRQLGKHAVRLPKGMRHIFGLQAADLKLWDNTPQDLTTPAPDPRETRMQEDPDRLTVTGVTEFLAQRGVVSTTPVAPETDSHHGIGPFDTVAAHEMGERLTEAFFADQQQQQQNQQ